MGHNPTDGWSIEEAEDGTFYIAVLVDPFMGTTRPHTSGQSFAEYDDASDYLDALSERYEEQHDRYLEENREAIVASERYEMYRAEY